MDGPCPFFKAWPNKCKSLCSSHTAWRWRHFKYTSALGTLLLGTCKTNLPNFRYFEMIEGKNKHVKEIKYPRTKVLPPQHDISRNGAPHITCDLRLHNGHVGTLPNTSCITSNAMKCRPWDEDFHHRMSSCGMGHFAIPCVNHLTSNHSKPYLHQSRPLPNPLSLILETLMQHNNLHTVQLQAMITNFIVRQ